jgi:GNAT superfamily N-acetyltransferase
MRWLIKDIAKMDVGIRRMLRSATPNWRDAEDYMRVAARESVTDPKSGKYIAIALFRNQKLIGWAMCDLWLSQCSKKMRIYLYVKRQYRHMGFGTLLFRKAKEVAKRRGKGVRVCPHNKESRGFFRAIRITKEDVAPGYTLST